MKLEKLPAGKYVVAVSGGVDSVVLLNLLVQNPKLELIVAHIDHGMRLSSADDRMFVQGLARVYAVPYEYEIAQLGPNASEAVARDARYKFLRKVLKKQNAKAIITAHHQDDLLETIMINLLRGTGRKGITALKDQPDVLRPMLKNTKAEILKYAEDNGLEWQEDETNVDTTYLRNWIRHNLVPNLSDTDRKKFLKLHADLSKRNPQIDKLLAQYVSKEIVKISRQEIVMADHALAREIVASWLRANQIGNFDQRTVERIVIGAKTLGKGKLIPVMGNLVVEVQSKWLLLKVNQK